MVKYGKYNGAYRPYKSNKNNYGLLNKYGNAKRGLADRVKTEKTFAKIMVVLGILVYVLASVYPILIGDVTYSTENLYSQFYDTAVSNGIMLIIWVFGCYMIYHKNQAITFSGVICCTLAIVQIATYSIA